MIDSELTCVVLVVLVTEGISVDRDVGSDDDKFDVIEEVSISEVVVSEQGQM